METRIRVIHLVLAAGFLILGLGFFNLEVIQARKFGALSEKNCVRLLTQDGSRGRILDRQCVDDAIFKIANWNLNISNFDVR